MKPKLERTEAEAREEMEADAEAETRRSANEDAEREAEKAGRVRGSVEKKREPAERVTRAMKASCSSSYMESARRWTWRAISSSKPTSSASSAARSSNSRARLHNKRVHDNTW